MVEPAVRRRQRGCNVDGFAEPAGPRVTDYFDLSRSTADIDAELGSEDREIDPGTYRYARVELCKALGGQAEATVPTLMWKAADMAGEQPFTSGDCGRTSLELDPPLVLAAGDRVGVQLGYDLAQAIMTGAPADAGVAGCGTALAGLDHCFRACVDVSASERSCMDFPDFAPTAVTE